MNFIAKLIGIDLNRSYTEEELNAIKARWDNILRNMIVGTYTICAVMVIVAYIFQKIK